MVRELIAENPWATIVSSNEGTLVASHTRFVCKVKMSQDKDLRSREQVLDALRGPGHYGNPALAAEMQRALSPTSQ